MSRKFVNWDAIEPLWRQGKLSNYDIAAQYAADHIDSQTWKTTVSEKAIRKRAKDKGWEKNLAEKVRAQIKENLVRSQVRSADQGKKLSDKEIVDKAAEAGSNVVLRHQREAAALKEHEDRLLEELKTAKKLFITQYQGQIVEKPVDMTAKEKSACLKDLASVRAQRIALERQAHNIGDGVGADEVQGLLVEFVGVD